MIYMYMDIVEHFIHSTSTKCTSLVQVGERQRRRKIRALKQYAVNSLQPCMESYGLTATAVTAVSDAGTPITLSLADVPEQSGDSTANTAEADIRARTLYLLDRFGVSDEFYHELAQVHLHRICAVLCICMKKTF